MAKTKKKKLTKKPTNKKVAKKAAPKKAAKKTVKIDKKTSNKKVAKKDHKKVSKKAAPKVVEKKTAAKKVLKKAAEKVSEKVGAVKTKVAVEKPEPLKVAKKVPEKVPAKAKTEGKADVKADRSENREPAKITIEKDIVLTDAEGRILCRVRECDQPAVVETYCRYHYLLFWKKIQIRKKILSEGKLEKYIEELTARYPNKYLDLIKKDLSTEAGFLQAIQELEIDESSSDDDARDYDEERSFIEEVRGVTDSNDRDESEY